MIEDCNKGHNSSCSVLVSRAVVETQVSFATCAQIHTVMAWALSTIAFASGGNMGMWASSAVSIVMDLGPLVTGPCALGGPST